VAPAQPVNAIKTPAWRSSSMVRWIVRVSLSSALSAISSSSRAGGRPVSPKIDSTRSPVVASRHCAGVSATPSVKPSGQRAAARQAARNALSSGTMAWAVKPMMRPADRLTSGWI
jgi:hypothetical protein